MDWQLVEISVITVLALWVILFTQNSFSRAAAALMLVLNILWILFERERPRQARTPKPSRQDETPPAPAAPEAAPPREGRRDHRIL